MRSFAVAATMVASASVALAGSPSAVVNNNCNFPVYLWSVADSTGDMQTIQPGSTWSEPYQQRSTGGCSIKISTGNNIWGGIPITQFEYTYTPEGAWSGLFWDMSNIDGDPFNQHDTEIIPALTNGASNTSSCSTVNCPAGASKCSEAYNVWNDDFATHECPLETSLTFNICGSGSGSSSSSSNSGSSSSAAPASSPVVQSPAPQAQSPTPTPTPTLAPVSTPTPEPVTTVVQAVASSPAPVAVAAAFVGGPVVSWSGGNVVLGKHSKREAHENHMERHERIRRMHHARTMA